MTQQTTRRLSLQQRRAASAYAQVNTIAKDRNGKEYGSLVRGLPAMIQTDGLAQTLAFLLAKAGNDVTKPHHRAYDHLKAWLSQPDQFNFGNRDLLQWLLTQDSATYRMVATETLAYLGWMKRFVEALDLGDVSDPRGGE
jgi:CRISPR-associated protein Cmr5